MAPDETIAGRLSFRVRQGHDHIAVTEKEAAWTFGQLESAANQFARAVVDATENPGDRVAIMAELSASTLAGFLGVLISRRIAVPMSPGWPDARVEAVLRDSGAGVVATPADGRRRVPGGLRWLPLPESDATEEAMFFGPADDAEIGCLLYTSGSTGAPKGVPRTHQALIHNALVFAQGIDLRADDRVASFTPFATAQGIASALATLLGGAQLCCLDPRTDGLAALASWIDAKSATIVLMTPSLFRELDANLPADRVFPQVRRVRLGNEPARRNDFIQFRRRFPRPEALLVNALASTETGVIAQVALSEVSADGGELLPLGCPVAGTVIHLWDENGLEAPPGTAGEIVVEHDALPSSYWGQPAGTISGFLGSAGGLVFRTGDLGRWRSDGFLEFVGRRDLRVKLRGHRIEIEEIEAVLARLPDVEEAAASVVTLPDGREVLGAFLVARSEVRPDAVRLREHAQRTLPEHMIPNVWQWIETLPRLAGGKLDRRALAALPPVPATDRSRPYHSAGDPGDSLTVALRELWTGVLQVPSIGLDHNFFVSGGDSLRVMVLIHRIAEVFGIEVPASAAYQHPTVAALAEYVRTCDPGAPRPPATARGTTVIRLNAAESPDPIFLLPSGDGRYAGLSLFVGIARAMEPEWPLYGLMSTSAASVAAAAASHLRILRERQPRGPYRLIGGCLLGIMAFELAQQLCRAGEQVTLVLFDTPFPGPLATWERRLRRLFSGHYQWEKLWQWSRRQLAQRRPFRSTPPPPMPVSELSPSAPRPDQPGHPDLGDLMKRYRPVRFPGRLVLILSQGSEARWLSRGWRKMAINGAETHWVPGDHLSVRKNSSELFARILRSTFAKSGPGEP